MGKSNAALVLLLMNAYLSLNDNVSLRKVSFKVHSTRRYSTEAGYSMKLALY